MLDLPRILPGASLDRVVLDGYGLGLTGLVRLAEAVARPVVPPGALDRVRLAHETADRLAAPGRWYGRGTGVGAHRSVTVDPSDATRLQALSRADLTGLPAFLTAGPASSSGTMILEYTANSALAELRSSAAPASAGHTVLAHGLEEAASFAGQAAKQAERAAAAYPVVLACELVAAVRALRLAPVAPTVPAFRMAVEALPGDMEDRALTGDVTAAMELLPLLAEV